MSEKSEQTGSTRRKPDPRLAPRPPMATAQLAGIVSGIAGGILIVAGLLTWSIKKAFLPWPLVMVLVGVAGIVFYVLSNRESLSAFWRQKTPRLILNSVAFALFIAAILVLINIIGGRHHYRHDFTANKQYALSQQTMKVVQGLDKPVTMTAFVSPDYYSYDAFKSCLREYQALGGKLSVTTYDPKTAIDKDKEFNVRSDGTIIIQCGTKKENIVGISGTLEQQITSALLAVSKGEKTKLYFLSGHGERRLDSTSEDSIADLKKFLDNQQYESDTLVLATEKNPKIPADCACLMIMGPQQPLLPKEITAINNYLSQGGKAFICLAAPPAPDLHQILEPHGISVLKGVVYDPVQALPNNPGVTLVVSPEQDELTQGLQLFCMPLARALKIAPSATPPQPQYPGAPPPPPQKKGTPLLETSPQSWLDTNLNPTMVPQKPAGTPTAKYVLAAKVDESTKPQPPAQPGMPPPPKPKEGSGARLVVVGNVDFLTPRVGQLENIGIAFATKAVAWLTQQTKLISIPPKQHTNRTITLAGVQAKVVMILVFAIPVLILLAGIFVYVLRRR